MFCLVLHFLPCVVFPPLLMSLISLTCSGSFSCLCWLPDVLHLCGTALLSPSYSFFSYLFFFVCLFFFRNPLCFLGYFCEFFVFLCFHILSFLDSVACFLISMLSVCPWVYTSLPSLALLLTSILNEEDSPLYANGDINIFYSKVNMNHFISNKWATGKGFHQQQKKKVEYLSPALQSSITFAFQALRIAS